MDDHRKRLLYSLASLENETHVQHRDTPYGEELIRRCRSVSKQLGDLSAEDEAMYERASRFYLDLE